MNKRQPIHAEAPTFKKISLEQELLGSGIKVNLLAFFANGVIMIRSFKIYNPRFSKVGVIITVLVIEPINYMAKDCGVSSVFTGGNLLCQTS